MVGVGWQGFGGVEGVWASRGLVALERKARARVQAKRDAAPADGWNGGVRAAAIVSSLLVQLRGCCAGLTGTKKGLL